MNESLDYFNPLTRKVYKRMTHCLDVMKVQSSTGKYGMSKHDKGTCQVPLTYIVSEYGFNDVE